MSNDINQDIAKELVAQTAGKAYEDVAHPTAHATGKLISFIPRTSFPMKSLRKSIVKRNCLRIILKSDLGKK